MSNLILFGDSFTAGNGCLPTEEYTKKYKKTDGDLIWGEIVANSLELTLRNFGMGLFSNDKILDSIIAEYENISEDDIVIIGKTFYFRVDIPNKKGDDFMTLAPNHFTSIENQYSKEEIAYLNNLLIMLDNPLVKARHDFRFNFFKKILEQKKVKKVLIWEISDFCNSFEEIWSATNSEIMDHHWSYKGHKDFANYILEIIKN